MKIEIVNSPFSVHDNILYKFLHLFLVDDVVYNTESYPHTNKKLYQLKITDITNPFWILHNEQEYIKYNGSDTEYSFYYIPLKGDNTIKITSIDKSILYCSMDMPTSNKDIFLGLTAEKLKTFWNKLYQTQANTYYDNNKVQDLDGNWLTPEWKFTKAVGALLGVDRYSKFTDDEYYTFLHNVFDMNFYGGTVTSLYLLRNALVNYIDKIDVIPFEEYFPHTDLYNKLFLDKGNKSYSVNFGGQDIQTLTNIKFSDEQIYTINFWIEGGGDQSIFSIYNDDDLLECTFDGGDIQFNINGNILKTLTYNGGYDLITFVKHIDSLQVYINGVLDNAVVYTNSIINKDVDCKFILGCDVAKNAYTTCYFGEIQFLDNYILSDIEILDFHTYGIVDNYSVFPNAVCRFNYKWIYAQLSMNYSNDNNVVLENTITDSDLDDTKTYPYRKRMNDGIDDNILLYPSYMFYDRQWKKIDYHNQSNTFQNKYVYVDGEEDIYNSLVLKSTTDINIYKTEYLTTQRFDATDFRKDSTDGFYTGYPNSMYVILDKPNIDSTVVVINNGGNYKDISIGSYYNNNSPYNIVNLMALEDTKPNIDYIDVQYRTFKNNQLLGYCIEDSSTYEIEKSGHLNVDDVNLGNSDNQYGSIVIVIRTDSVIDDEMKRLIEYLIDNVIPAHIKWYIMYDFDAWRNWGQTDLIFGDFINPMSIFYKTKYKDFL